MKHENRGQEIQYPPNKKKKKNARDSDQRQAVGDRHPGARRPEKTVADLHQPSSPSRLRIIPFFREEIPAEPV